ncbi:hypothetical protein Tco_0371198 [Tanacetum coccineum]
MPRHNATSSWMPCLLSSLFCLKATTKFSCVVRVVATLPDRPKNFRSSSCGTYRIRLTLEDPTAIIHAYLNAEDATVILLFLLMMMMLNEPFPKALESVLVELANSLSSSALALAEHNSKAPVSNTEAGSSSLKKKDKHQKGTEGVKFRDVQPPPKGVDLSVSYSRWARGRGPSGTNKATTDGVEKKKEKVRIESLNEPLLRHAAATSGPALVEHMNQMRQYCQDRC